MHSGIMPSVLCGLPSSLPVTTVVNGGGDNTLVSEIFSIVSLCASSLNRDSPTNETNGMKGKLNNPHGLAFHSCLLLATIAQFFKSAGRNSALFILTTSSKKQQSRLSALAHIFSCDDGVPTSLQPHCASAMLAFASILSLESGASAESSVSDIAMPLVPRTGTLYDHLKMHHKDENGKGCAAKNCCLSHWHGLRDGCVGLLECRLKWGGPLAVQQCCASGIPQLLIDLLGNSTLGDSQAIEHVQDPVGLSPFGVVWAVSSLSHCLSGGALTFRQIMLHNEHVKCIRDLISDAHVKLIKSWAGPGGGKNGVRDTVNAVIDFLGFPFVAVQNASTLPSATASVSSGFLLNVGSPGTKVCREDTETLKAIKENMDKYARILLEAGVPVIVLRCIDSLESKDTGKPVALLAKLTSQKPLAFHLVGRGMLEATRMRRLLDGSSPKEVILDVLMIVSELARMDKGFYEYIDKANILTRLKEFLTYEDPNLRAKACSALGNMCRHSSYFYDSLAKHNIISLLIDRCTDPDKRTRKFACFAIGNAAYYNDLLYEELRRSIPHLTNLLLSPEEDKTKANAAGALSNLVRNSNKLCEDIVSSGAIQALLKVASDCSTVALNPPRRDAVNESPLKIVLFALAKMCGRPPCRHVIRSSELFPVIARIRQSPEPTIANYATLIYDKANGA